VGILKILITGFEPFGGESLNPSYEAVKLIENKFNGSDIIKLEVPTAFYKSAQVVISKIDEVKPDAVIMIGQAGGRADITVERVAINIDDASIKDNIGQKPVDSVIDKDGLNAYFATLPIKEIVEKIKNAGIPASISNSAGTYVCNHLMYSVLNYIYKSNLNIKAGFIHVPYTTAQVIAKPQSASMSMENIKTAIDSAILAVH
jgi:pyroglutamyl-peptidase